MLLEKPFVIKASPVIHISNTISKLQRDTWNLLLVNAYENLLKQDVFCANLDEVFDGLNLGKMKSKDSWGFTHFKGAIESLNTTLVKWNILGKDKSGFWKTEEFAAIPLLAGTRVNFKERTIVYGFSPLLRQKLHNPAMYARICWAISNNFVSKHTTALYELFADYFDLKRKKGETPWISLDDYRDILGIRDGDYREFKRLNARLIQDPLKEINKKSDLDVRVLKKKEKRRIVAIKFIIEGKKTFQMPMPFITPESYPELEEKKDIELKDKFLMGRLIDHLGEELASKFAEEYDEERLSGNLTEYEKQLKLGKVEGKGWLISAIQTDYRPKKSSFEIKEEKRKEEEEKKTAKLKSIKEDVERIKNECAEHNTRARMEIVRGLPETERDDLDKEFKDKNKHLGGMLKDLDISKIDKSAAAKALFFSFIYKKYPNAGMSIEEYAKKKGAKKEVLKALSE